VEAGLSAALLSLWLAGASAAPLPVAAPEAVGFRPRGLDDADRVVQDFVAQRAFPGGVLAVGKDGVLVHLRAFGRLTYDPEAPAVSTDTLYDLASLTKVVATTTVAMILVDEGRLDLDRPVSSYLPDFCDSGRERVTVRHLLTHSAGLPAWAPAYRLGQGHWHYLDYIEAEGLQYEPGTQSVYSDLGVILLGEILERITGEPLDAFAKRRVFEPLGLADTGYCPDVRHQARTAPTEIDPDRGGLLQGVVHDENAYALGGVAPHAGLFSTASDLARFAQMLLAGGEYGGRRLVSAEAVALFTHRAGIPGSSRAIGWDTPSPEDSSAGAFVSPESFGHTGFTGTSLWIDPARRLFVILLTNRVHPTRDNDAIREARPAVMDAVLRALATPGPAVALGIDRLRAENGGALRGKRVGLVVHAASVDAEGRRTIEVLRDAGVDVVRLFSPEHGLHGRAAAGEHVAETVDGRTGLPVVSLYGARTRPAPEDLAGLDALVFDLQDAGVRFYTYASTLLLCLDAAASAGIEMVVLDRPNPLGGLRIAGPVAESSRARPLAPADDAIRRRIASSPRTDAAPRHDASLLSMAPGPLVHGMTVGEMARYANAHRLEPARLTVVPMAGWTRDMTWADTGLVWVRPSPNLRTAEAALAYPGVALLEATNVSEGRGTDTPFLVFGAPWLDPDTLGAAVSVPGFALAPTRFTPRASSAAPEPKYRDQECRGLRVQVTDPGAADPYALGLVLLSALRRTQPEFRLLEKGAVLDRLIGTPRVRRRLARGTSAAEIIRADSPALTLWNRAREAARLY
jgi:uncharacterized protein YbbC (DUF1343 family)/CubicO group peptidase (beta-lactamase class C family)